MRDCAPHAVLMRRICQSERLKRQEAQTLWGHLKACTGCQAEYDRTMLFYRWFENKNHNLKTPSDTELSWMEPLVSSPEPTGIKATLAHFSAQRWTAAMVASLCVAIGVGVSSMQRDQWTARGQQPPTLALRTLCTTPSGSALRVHSLSNKPGPNEVSACPLGSTLEFVVQADEGGFLFIAHEEEGQLHWLLPDDQQGAKGFKIEASHRLVPSHFRYPIQDLPSSPKRDLSFFIAFASEPLPLGKVQEMYQKNHKEGSGLESLRQAFNATFRVRRIAVIPRGQNLKEGVLPSSRGAP